MHRDQSAEPGIKYTHAGGVVYRRRDTTPELLLVTARLDPTMWVLPKGHIERGEFPDQTAMREVLEEAGVTARIIEFLLTSRQVVRGRSQVIAYYLMEIVSEGAQSEGRRVEWLAQHEAIRRVSFEESRNVLKQACVRLAERFPH